MLPTRHDAQESDHEIRHWSGASGLTLIELMIAMLLLGVIFSAAATSLITFTRSAADNERRVQATAVMNGLHEEFQTTRWDALGMYEQELDVLLAEGLVEPDGTQFKDQAGDTVVMLGDLGGAPRDTEVPIPDYDLPLNDREYEVRQFITWQDRTGSGVGEMKRLTTYVTWNVLGRELTERFDSERAATADEAGDPTRPRVIHFLAGPKLSQLNELDRNSQAIEVSVRFSQPVILARMEFYRLSTSSDADLVLDWVPLDVNVSADGGGLSFTGSIPADVHRFTNGLRTLRAIGQSDSGDAIGYASISFAGGDIAHIPDPDGLGADDGEGDGDEVIVPGTPPSISAVTASRYSVCLASNGRLIDPLTIRARVEGLAEDDYNVTASYSANKTKNVEMVAENGTVSADGTDFMLVLQANTNYGFKGGDQTTFDVVASRPQSDNATAGPVLTPLVTFLGHKATEC